MSSLRTVDSNKQETKIIYNRLQKWPQYYATPPIMNLFPSLSETCFGQNNV